MMEIKIKKRKKPKMKMLKRILAHHPLYLKGLQGANLKTLLHWPNTEPRPFYLTKSWLINFV